MEPNDSEEAEKALQAAYKLLSYRPRSVREITARLGRRGYSGQAVEVVVEKLTTLGLLDDRDFATFWRTQRQSWRPKGRALMRAELRAKGVAPEVISTVLAEGLSEEEAAWRAAQARAPALGSYDGPKFVARMAAYLQRRGFSLGISLGTARRVWAETRSQ